MIIKTRNLLDQLAPTTYLTNPEVSGTSVLRWKNPNGFNASWAVQVGKTGAKQSEVVVLGTATPSGTAGTLTGNTLYEHPTDTPLYATKYDQVVFEVSTAGTSGTASPITGGTVTIQPDSLFTQFDHTAGTPAYAYKTYFRNSVLNVTTTESDWLTSSGFSFYSLGKLRQRVKDRLFDVSYITSDLIIDDWLNEWLQRMNNAMVDVNEDYGLGTVNVAYAGTAELGTVTNTDFRGNVVRVWSISSTGTFTSAKMEANSFVPSKTFTQTFPYHYFLGDSVIGRQPHDTDGTLALVYPLNQPLLVNDTDTVPVPMQGYTQSFIDYGHGMALLKDNKTELAGPVLQRAEADLKKFQTEITPHSRTGPTYIQIVEDIGSDQDIWL